MVGKLFARNKASPGIEEVKRQLANLALVFRISAQAGMLTVRHGLPM
jgi:hypothetical protein